jgi:hypothetical protein
LRVLREMGEQHQGAREFDWDDFEFRLNEEKIQAGQRSMLEMRLDVVRSFMPRVTKLKQRNKGKLSSKNDSLVGLSGQLTIVDFTDPMLDPETVCVLFDIALTRFVDRTPGGKVVALDEAHNVSFN